ncbi:MAG TPA: hypothetical protein VHB98_04670 [Chloroflexota bacterium]|jgi:hypothetical protein|nr:hypothetical protein [Chloroflexota bacterium]
MSSRDTWARGAHVWLVDAEEDLTAALDLIRPGLRMAFWPVRVAERAAEIAFPALDHAALRGAQYSGQEQLD